MSKLSDLVRQEPRPAPQLPAWLERLIAIGIVANDPQVARRQRFANVAAFALLANSLIHMIKNSLYDFDGLFTVNIYNAIMMAVALVMPQLHRYGRNLAALVLAVAMLFGIQFVVWAVGLNSNLHLYYTMAGALLFLFGVENLKLFLAFFAAFAAALLIVLNFAPAEGFVLPGDAHLRDMLSSDAMINTIAINAAVILYALTSLRRAETELELQYARSETLISAVLPQRIAARLKSGAEKNIADRIDNLSVMFADLVGFTEASHDLPPDRVVAYLDDLVHGFEDLCESHNVEKIKSIGDGYMAVAGLEGDPRAGAVAIGKLALAMMAQNAERAPLGSHKLGLRIGLHCGPAVAGVIGGTRFSYDVWGDAVNIAARMESTGVTNRVQVSEQFCALAGDAFEYEERGATALKGIGEAKTYFLVGERSPV